MARQYGFENLSNPKVDDSCQTSFQSIGGSPSKGSMGKTRSHVLIFIFKKSLFVYINATNNSTPIFFLIIWKSRLCRYFQSGTDRDAGSSHAVRLPEMWPIRSLLLSSGPLIGQISGEAWTKAATRLVDSVVTHRASRWSINPRVWRRCGIEGMSTVHSWSGQKCSSFSKYSSIHVAPDIRAEYPAGANLPAQRRFCCVFL